MSDFDKKYIIREAENILEQCGNRSLDKKKEKDNVISLKIYNKRLKRKIIFWKVLSASNALFFLISIITR